MKAEAPVEPALHEDASEPIDTAALAARR